MATEIIMYTDGAASGNPGPGGYGTVLISGKHRKDLSEGYRLTTNNRMELWAVIAGLEALKTESCNVTIYSDSKYVVDSVTKGWVFGWQKKGFKGKKNSDLWKRFLAIYPKHKVTFQWIKGHANIPGNEIADQLAVIASKKRDLQIDNAYETGESKDALF